MLIIDVGVEVAFNDDYKCHLCKTKFEDRKNCTPKQKRELREEIKKRLGCTKKGKKPKVRIENRTHAFELYYCPGNYSSSKFSYYWRLWESYKNGVAVAEGHIGNWPTKLVDTLEYLDSKVEEKRKIKEEQWQTKSM